METQKPPQRLSTAILLNAFVMPGSGQILVGMTAKGYAIAALTTLFVILPLLRYTLTVMGAMRQIAGPGEGMARGLSALSGAWQQDRTFIFVCLAAVVLLWLYGIVDLIVFQKGKRP